jgi:uncharacterized protein (TIGR02271 family)
MDREQRSGTGTETLQRYEDYTVYDRDGDKIGKVDELFVDENDQIEYIGVKMGLFGLQGTRLIPWEATRTDEREHRIELSVDKETVKNGPAFENDEDITADYEKQIYSHYGLGGRQGTTQRGAYGDYYRDENDATSRSAAAAGLFGEERHTGQRRGAETRSNEGLSTGERRGEAGPGMIMGDTESGRFEPHDPRQEGPNEPESDLEDEDELRVQRVEEELRIGTREREAGAMRVRKRVRTEREQLRVPKRREEVHVERVPVEGREAPEADIGEDEVVMPVTEEEVIVEKRPEVKEEIRVRKGVVQDEELVEEDVRREEVDVDDQTERGRDVGRGAGPDEETRRRGR